jgi:hypothetical protein
MFEEENNKLKIFAIGLLLGIGLSIMIISGAVQSCK